MLSLWHIALLGIVQGLAELLPVSSSAHVIVAEKWLGLDPTAPEMTFLLVMLHTGTMISVLIYFWKRWVPLLSFWKELLLATFFTFALGLVLKEALEKVFVNFTQGRIENLFGQLPLIAVALTAAGAIILWGSRKDTQIPNKKDAKIQDAIWIGLVQGLCIPFRGFSRSGATISTGLIRGLQRSFSEEFSFALAVILTPAAIVHQLHRLVQSQAQFSLHMLKPGLLGMVCSFLAGLVALKWLSSWLEKGSWKRFGFYCFGFALVVLLTYFIRK